MYDAIVNFVFSKNTLIYYYGIPALFALAYKISELYSKFQDELKARRFRADAGEAWGGHLNVGDLVSCFFVAAIPVVNIVVALIGAWHLMCNVTTFLHNVLDIKLVAPVARVSKPKSKDIGAD